MEAQHWYDYGGTLFVIAALTWVAIGLYHVANGHSPIPYNIAAIITLTGTMHCWTLQHRDQLNKNWETVLNGETGEDTE